ncbi:MAG: [Fe-Fe] hydrogenase large subunit C-terminal domain-containing protein [Myxococcota bacterium]|jgi:NADH-quinone oxidoreductase subunit G|nr:[Fe-Fe] hydrogenase large subunit C-terminal domain-containing protein [Myxococcota bacterium]
MNTSSTMLIDGRQVSFSNERNVLEVVRKAGIELPTFCYHSQLSVYGACRLCLVDIEGRGIVTSCSTIPEPGLVIRTQTPELRSMRKISLELLLANHEQACPTCSKSASCQLQALARKLGVHRVRFKPVHKHRPLDLSSPALVRDPNKCILCGDCVRMCAEVQGIGAIDFARRGHDVFVGPAFGKGLAEVDCVHCGQCAAVCPTGAIAPRSHIDQVMDALDDPEKVVVAQIAPAVRVALGEAFGLRPGSSTMGQAVAALKRLGFDKVFDTAFAADLTVLEEATEFLGRMHSNNLGEQAQCPMDNNLGNQAKCPMDQDLGEQAKCPISKKLGEQAKCPISKKLPQFTSCCPAWVSFVERHHPELLSSLSSCRSPQQMFGAVARELLPTQLGIERRHLVVVSIMPCTAKKVEAGLQKFSVDGRPDVDFVLTTQELAQLIERAGLRFHELEPASLDLPLGFKTGAGVIFGNTGGVAEAVLRYAGEKLGGHRQGSVEFHAVRGLEGIRTASVRFGEQTLRLAIAHGLANAKELIRRLQSGELEADLVEVMACPGGCVGGAGQPITSSDEVLGKRAQGLYDADRTLQLHKSQENHLVAELYRNELGDCGGEKAHELLHTSYQHRRRIVEDSLALGQAGANALCLRVCVGTNCHLKGAQDLLHRLLRYVHEHELDAAVDVQASFCFERCDRGPTVSIEDEVIERCSFEQAVSALERRLLSLPQSALGALRAASGEQQPSAE